MDGIIVINKPKGCTSHDIVYKIKRITGEKVGHTGTLDPNATGVLPLLIGKGTKLSKYLINHDKIYEVTLKLGERTDTADSEGNIVETKKIDKSLLEEKSIIKTLNSFIGKQKQVPPIYSAIKVNGKKLYEYARKGEKIELEPREIEIYEIQLLHINKESLEIEFRVSCSKGTYIRSLCEDIAKKLYTVGFMKELNRIQVGEFNITESITVDEIEKNAKESEKGKEKIFLQKHLISIENLFKDNLFLKLNNNDMKSFLDGVKLKVNQLDGIYRIYDENNSFIGIGVIENKILKRDIIL